MVVIRQQRKSRLSTMIDQSGGVSIGVAMAQATANLEAMKPRGREIVAAQIAQLAALPAPTGPDEALITRAYGLSSDIVDAAGPLQMEDICVVASGLCDLLDAALTDTAFDWRVVTVHVQALQLMQSLPADADDARHRVLEGLAEVLRIKLQPTG